MVTYMFLWRVNTEVHNMLGFSSFIINKDKLSIRENTVIS